MSEPEPVNGTLIKHIDKKVEEEAERLLSRLLLGTLKALVKKINSGNAVPADFNNAIKILKDNDVVINKFKPQKTLENLEEAVSNYDSDVIEYIDSYRD